MPIEPSEKKEQTDALVDLLVNQNWVPGISNHDVRATTAVQGLARYLYERGVRVTKRRR